GFEASEPRSSEATVMVQMGFEGEGLMGWVQLSPCDPFACWDLDREVDASHEANLKSMLPTNAMEDPDLVFEYGNVEPVAGYEAFYVYSFHFSRDGTSASGGNQYRLLYHDGRVVIAIDVQPEH